VDLTNADRVTPRHLLTHTSGIPASRHSTAVRSVVAYSSSGYRLLDMIASL
jgi:CubicO group peptidase (beta-lactamase class C family)